MQPRAEANAARRRVEGGCARFNGPRAQRVRKTVEAVELGGKLLLKLFRVGVEGAERGVQRREREDGPGLGSF
eukprot:1430031-Rhodomonas_salina.1